MFPTLGNTSRVVEMTVGISACLAGDRAATCAECLAAGKDYCIADNRSLHLGSESALKAEQLQLQLQLLVPKRLSLSVGIGSLPGNRRRRAFAP